MDISLQCRLPETDRTNLLGQLERRLGFAIGRFAESISEVHFSVDDVNGPRGGNDIEARAEVRLLPHGTVQVHGRYATAELAIDGLSHRLKLAIRRHLDRQRVGPGDRTSMAG